MSTDEQQWPSPTRISTAPNDGTSTTSTLYNSILEHPQPATNLYIKSENRSSRQSSQYYSHPSTTLTAPWSAPTSSTMGLHDYLQPQQSPLPMLHHEHIIRSNDDDLAIDAQMLREVLQELPSGQTPVNATQLNHSRGQQMPGLQLLFASPMLSTDMTTTGSHAPTSTFYTNSMGMATGADMLLQTSSGLSSTSIFPSVQSQDRSVHLSLPVSTVGITGTYDPLASAAAAATAPLARKKRTTVTRICKIEGCTKGIRSRGLCKAHGGGRRCTTPGCTTSDQGGGHCVLHGGGRRCRIEGCKKSAQWRGVCKMHGGARRCRYGQCTKNGQVKQGYCRMHHNLLTAQRQQQEQLQAQQQHYHRLQQTQLPSVHLQMGGTIPGPSG